MVKQSTLSSFLGRLFFIGFLLLSINSIAQEHSVAMKWNEVQLNCIRKDAARPTVQARNLFHASIIMYDAWAAFDDDASTFFLGQTWNGFPCPYNGIIIPEDKQAAQEKAISYAMYRFLFNRYSGAPQNNWNLFMIGYCNDLMAELGYPTDVTSVDYSDGDPAKLGNYIAARMQAFALQDGSRQQFNYANAYYQAANGDIFPELPGNPFAYDGNRWQPLTLTVALDQAGFPIANSSPALSAEWGNVVPFSLTDEDKEVFFRDSHNWNVYLDQGAPPLLDTVTEVARQWDEDFFRWGYATVAIWHSFHDVADGVMKDISPASIGNIDESTFPTTFEEFKNFYNVFEGGDPSVGYDVNPVTGLPYEEQLVPRGDYSRVLSEYWADGPQSETPPGHWFTIINNISNHPLFEKRWEGQGAILNDLEFDVRSYLALGGGIHDAAVACWSTKGYYDYTRPIMAIRYMIDHGQCSDMNLPSYDPAGIPLIPGFIELVQEGDPLAGANNENVNKVKLYTFRGPVEATGMDGVGWILGENWWTFQVRTFVTPPFPGYYSGHSTYSRTAAEILTRLTGSEYFPGGYGEFFALKNEYLRASEGPSVDTRLQWARYADAADQCSLSRIYGGLHPPQDDIPGRKVGMIIGPRAFDKANGIQNAGIPHVVSISPSHSLINDSNIGEQLEITVEFTEEMDAAFIPEISFTVGNPTNSLSFLNGSWTDATHYVFVYDIIDANEEIANTVCKIENAKDLENNTIVPALANMFQIDTDNPVLANVIPSDDFINDAIALDGLYTVEFSFDQVMNMDINPTISFPVEDASSTLIYNANLSFWSDNQTFFAVFDAIDANVAMMADVTVSGAQDMSGNAQDELSVTDAIIIDTENPIVTDATSTTEFVNVASIGTQFTIDAVFGESLDPTAIPAIAFSDNSIFTNTLGTLITEGWTDASTYSWTYSVNASNEEIPMVDVTISGTIDLYGNVQETQTIEDAFGVDTQPATVTAVNPSITTVTDASLNDGTINFEIVFDDEMDMTSTPTFEFSNVDAASSIFELLNSSSWLNDYTYNAAFTILDGGVEYSDVNFTVTAAADLAGNPLATVSESNTNLLIDTRNPINIGVVPSISVIVSETPGINLTFTFDEPMDITSDPVVTFPFDDISSAVIQTLSSGWTNDVTFNAVCMVNDLDLAVSGVDVQIAGARDVLGNNQEVAPIADVFDMDQITSVEEWNQSVALELFPNPVKAGNDVTVKMNVVPADLVVSLMDASGKLVQQLPISAAGGNQITVGTKGVSAGNYFVQLTSNGVSVTLKLALLN